MTARGAKQHIRGARSEGAPRDASAVPGARPRGEGIPPGGPRLAWDPAIEARLAVERVIDAQYLDGLLDLISDICIDKAEHVTTTWHDSGLASKWMQAGIAFQLLKEQAAIRRLS